MSDEAVKNTVTFLLFVSMVAGLVVAFGWAVAVAVTAGALWWRSP